MTEPVNQLHKTLRVLSEEDPTLQRPIAFLHGCIKLQTYDTVRADPGVQAWFQENWALLCDVSAKRREAYNASV